MRAIVLSLIALGLLVLSGGDGNAVVTMCTNTYNNILYEKLVCESTTDTRLLVYTTDEVDRTINAQAIQIQSLTLQLIQLTAKTAQDEQQLTTGLQADLENKVERVLTPALLKQIQDAAAADALSRVLTTLRAQGVIH